MTNKNLHSTLFPVHKAAKILLSSAFLAVRILFFIKYSCGTFKQMPCKIIVAHINQGIRGSDADNDEKFVKNLAEKFEQFGLKRNKIGGEKRFGREGQGSTL